MMQLFLIPEVVIYLFVQMLLLLFHGVILLHAIAILRHFDSTQNSALQYRLEQKSAFAATAIRVGLWFGFLLLPFWIFVLDKMHHYLPGAMCAAGVVGANDYGSPMIGVMLVFLLLSALWLALHHLDMQSETLRYTRTKYRLYLALFALLLLQSALILLYLLALDPTETVACCSLLYGSGGMGDSGVTRFSPFHMALLSGGVWLLALLTLKRRSGLAVLLVHLLMLAVGFYSVTHLLSPYVYELPTHQCPYCLFQPDYLYVGYPLFGAMLIGGFAGIVWGCLVCCLGVELRALRQLSWLGWGIFGGIFAFYPLRYFLVNGVWL